MLMHKHSPPFGGGFTLPKRRAIAIILIATVGVAKELQQSHAYPRFDYRPSSTAVQYGTDRALSWRDVRRFKSLAYPQSRRAMTRAFGSGSYRDRDLDYYKLPDGRYLKVHYQNRQAVSFGY